jgi:hypothetical protein
MRLRSTGEALLAIACWRHRPRRQDRQRKDDQALPVSPGGYSSCAPAARGNVRSLRSLTVVSLRVGDPATRCVSQRALRRRRQVLAESSVRHHDAAPLHLITTASLR